MRHVFRYALDGEGTPGGEVELAPEDARHLTRVVRRDVGDGCEIIDTAGTIWPAVLVDAGPPARVRLADAPRRAPATVPLDLYVGLADWGRLDLVVEKATELGVERITFFASERARRRADGFALEGRRGRWERLMEAAARQSGTGGRPELRGLVPFSDVVHEISAADAFTLDSGALDGLGDALRAQEPARAAIVVGPEAGLSADESAALARAGARPCRLAGATLRTETAAIAAAAIAADHFRGR